MYRTSRFKSCNAAQLNNFIPQYWSDIVVCTPTAAAGPWSTPRSLVTPRQLHGGLRQSVKWSSLNPRWCRALTDAERMQEAAESAGGSVEQQDAEPGPMASRIHVTGSCRRASRGRDVSHCWESICSHVTRHPMTFVVMLRDVYNVTSLNRSADGRQVNTPSSVKYGPQWNYVYCVNISNIASFFISRHGV